jgi:hypothetical protein
MIVAGPNHALNAVLNLLTFWLCGGWAWIWLLVALSNKKTVQPVDAFGNPMPLTPQQIAAQAEDKRRQQLITWAVLAAVLVVMLILSALIH